MSASELEDNLFHLPTFSLSLLESLALDLYQCKKCNRIPRDALVCPLCQNLYCNEPAEGYKCFSPSAPLLTYPADDKFRCPL